MPWKKQENPEIDYPEGTVRVNEMLLVTTGVQEDIIIDRIANMVIKYFRRCLKNSKPNVTVVKVCQIQDLLTTPTEGKAQK